MNKIIHKYCEQHDLLMRYYTKRMTIRSILNIINDELEHYKFLYELHYEFMIDIIKADKSRCVCHKHIIYFLNKYYHKYYHKY